jgi:predicted RNA-binding protein
MNFTVPTRANGGEEMCLAKAYIKKLSDEPILQDIAYMQLNDNQVKLKTFFGEGKVISGRLLEVDFATSSILLDGEYETDESA